MGLSCNSWKRIPQGYCPGEEAKLEAVCGRRELSELIVCNDQVLAVDGVKYDDAGMSPRSRTTKKWLVGSCFS